MAQPQRAYPIPPRSLALPPAPAQLALLEGAGHAVDSPARALHQRLVDTYTPALPHDGRLPLHQRAAVILGGAALCWVVIGLAVVAVL